MKLKSLLLGSATVLALSTGAQAADPVASFVSLDICDALGVSGLTISSNTNCLRISGHIDYQFRWGDYRAGRGWYEYYGDRSGGQVQFPERDGFHDWRSRLETVLRFEAVSDTDGGPARAVLVLRDRQRSDVTGTPAGTPYIHDNDSRHDWRAQQAYVAVGDTTVLSAGIIPTILRAGNDVPYNFLGLFNSDEVDLGVDWKGGANLREGGAGITVVHNFGNGFSAGLGLENIARYQGGTGTTMVSDPYAGTVVGFVSADGSWGSAHLSAFADNALNGFDTAQQPTFYGFHAGATVQFDQFAIRAAAAGNARHNVNNSEYFNALLSGRAGFDIFTLAASVEYVHLGANNALNPFGASLEGLGFGASVGFDLFDGVALNLGGRYWDWDSSNRSNGNTEVWQVAAQIEASVAESLTANASLGYKGAGSGATTIPALIAGAPRGVPDGGTFYVGLGADYAPGGGFTTGANAELHFNGAYRLEFNARKSF